MDLHGSGLVGLLGDCCCRIAVTLKFPIKVGQNEGGEEAAVSSLTIWRRKARRLCLPESFQFSPFQFSLAMLGSLSGICSRLEIGFLDEVAPAFLPI